MKTVLNVKVDKKEKEEAQALAAEMGVPLSTIVNAHLREFLRTRTFTVSLEPMLRPEVAKEIERRSKEYHKNPKSALTARSVEEMRKVLEI